ncbi:hypothetical protein ATY37_14705 [Vibrio cidicii]|uniref:Uncharacterized protein n=1 Tax=Vibrio cidicii TaxID=1763883 RepID=A0A151KYG4_9VIBR|nr:hypothetical protein ATY37_14705 [Vibrio cidicii]
MHHALVAKLTGNCWLNISFLLLLSSIGLFYGDLCDALLSNANEVSAITEGFIASLCEWLCELFSK